MTNAYLIKIGVLLAVTIIYALFDVFNKRNIPDMLVFATVLLGVAVALVYNYNILLYDFVVAGVIGVIGFVVYRAGFLGGGDVLEMIFITLVLPVQGTPYYGGIGQLGLPFIISVIIGAGYTAMIFMPLYYVLYKRLLSGKRLEKPERRSMVLGVILLIAYAAFVGVFWYLSELSTIAIVLVLALAIASFVTLMFEKDIYAGMTAWIYPKSLESGDMIAINLMNRKELVFFKSKYARFGRLVTANAIQKLRNVNRKLPVYRDSVPFSLFLLLGILISLAIGNLILIMIAL